MPRRYEGRSQHLRQGCPFWDPFLDSYWIWIISIFSFSDFPIESPNSSTPTMAATLAPSSATTTSCCGIANLTFVSQGTAAGRLWKVDGQNDTGYSGWEEALKAKCSTPIPDVRLEHTPQWYDATCGPRALCQRMGGDDKNATSQEWTFGVRTAVSAVCVSPI